MRKKYQVQRIIVSMFGLFLILLFAFFDLGLEKSANASPGAQDESSLELRVDASGRARAFSDGIQMIVGMADYFEFFQQELIGGRKRITEGPWSGVLREHRPGKFSLTGGDPVSGAAYTITFTQAGSNSLELLLSFTAPSQPSNLGFDILKVSGDIFKGAKIEANPAGLTDVDRIPLQPSPLAQRILLTEKNQVLVKSALCDLEITDLTKSGIMLVADARNVPWDNKKSISFSGEMDNLSPGKTYSFRYSIRCLPSTATITMKNQDVPGNPVTMTNVWLTGGTMLKNMGSSQESETATRSWSFYVLPSKEERNVAGQYRLNAQDSIYGMPSGTAETMLVRELEKLTALRLPVKELEEGKVGRGIVFEHISPGVSSGLPSEGFEIVTTSDNVVIRAESARGCLYGVYAVMGRLRHNDDNWQLECGTVRDWPDIPVRGVCIEMSRPAIRDVALMKRYLDAFSRARSNVVIFLHIPQQMRSWQNKINDEGWTKEQIAEIALYARSLEMDVWAGMGSAFQAADFQEMDIDPTTNLYNPFVEESYNRLFSLYDELLQIYHPSTLLISHDEIQGLSVYAAKSGKSSAEILSMDVKKIHTWLNQRDVKTAMWGDMLLDFNVWEKKVGSANSQNSFFRSGATHLALNQIPPDVQILDWHYSEMEEFASIDYFRKNGFTVIGSPWHDPLAAQTMAQSVKKYGGQGVVTTDWGFWSTLSPAATTLYAPLCAWSTTCSIDGANRDVAALAETMRDQDGNIVMSQYGQNPVMLDIVANAMTTGLFTGGPLLDLQAFSAGEKILSGITFNVASDHGGTVNNCVVVGQGKKNMPTESVTFQGSTLARAVAFLHTGFVEEPQFAPRKLGYYLIDYENDRKETVVLQENWNITDIRSSEGLRHNPWTFIRSPDVLIGARNCWRGLSPGGVPLNLQVVVWKNPHPEQKIRSIRLNAAAAPLNSQIAIVGLTFLQ